mgnify:CR=1 FL=1
MRIVADQDTPAIGLDAVEDDLGGGGRGDKGAAKIATLLFRNVRREENPCRAAGAGRMDILVITDSLA